jgi:hypothetical protein
MLVFASDAISYSYLKQRPLGSWVQKLLWGCQNSDRVGCQNSDLLRAVAGGKAVVAEASRPRLASSASHA